MSAHIAINIMDKAKFEEMESRIKEGLLRIPNPEGVRVYICREFRIDAFPPDTPLVQVDFSRRQSDSRFAMKLTTFLSTLNPRAKLVQTSANNYNHNPHNGTIWEYNRKD